MIGIDTNVLLRLVLQDDAEQGRRATEFFSSLTEHNPGYVNLITLLEFTWTLRSGIKLSKEAIGQAVKLLLEARDVQLEDEECVDAALEGMLKTSNEFADLLVAIKNRQAGCDHTITFDKKAAKTVAGMELIG